MATITKKAAPKKAATPKKLLLPQSNAAKSTSNHTYDIYGALEQYFGFREFKGTQELAINSVLNGTDTFVIMPTGGGKSLMLPASRDDHAGLRHHCFSA
jgi:ATP-dependent DNA helicase RecQ